MLEDHQKLERTAQYLMVETAPSVAGPAGAAAWAIVPDARVEKIEINHGARFSRALISLPTLRWHEYPCLDGRPVTWGDRIRIRTDTGVCIFSGFLGRYQSGFTAAGQAGSGFENNAILCLDHRWLLARTSPLFGQIVRGPDDYTNYGAGSQTPIANSWFFASGRRCIFNYAGRPNRDPVLLAYTNANWGIDCQTPIFAPVSGASYWTARQMICHILAPLWNKAYDYFPIPDPAELKGLSHRDFDNILTGIEAEGLDVVAALDRVCQHLGWSFREDYDSNGNPELIFYQVGSATAAKRDDDNPTIAHSLYAPAVDENIRTAVRSGKKIICAMTLSEDIGNVINAPQGLGSPQRFEFTAELVPAWLDSQLAPDTSDSNANLFFNEHEIAEMDDPNARTFYKYYHSSGSAFRRDVGRKWALNESGRYSISGSYDRGAPFDFKNVIDNQYILDNTGKRIFAPYNRALLPCLTHDKDTLNSVGIRVEFSFDGGATYQVLPAVISALSSEAGIYIDQPNLAEIAPAGSAVISGGDLDGVPLNYYTSLADDKVNSRSFKNGDWQTRIRITASIQMDQRLWRAAAPGTRSGSPFTCQRLYDFSDRYKFSRREESSSFKDSGLPAWNIDQTAEMDNQLALLRSANEDMSIAGAFTLDRLWLGDTGGRDRPDFAVGDSVKTIAGRGYNLAASLAGRTVFPEIIQIVYNGINGRQRLIVRDLRFAAITNV